MHVLGLDESVPASLESTLREAMTARGSTGVIELTSDQPPAELDTDVELRGTLGPDGFWTVAGTDGSARSLLDELAPHCRYALVLGLGESDWPTLRLADGTLSGSLLSEPVPVDDVAAGALLDQLEETERWETLESLVARVKRSENADLAGAIATFTGRVRAKEHREDEPTERLEFEKYGAVAGEEMERISTELRAREGVQEVLMHHRTGVILAGVDIVFVVVLAGHREEAFRTVEDGINRLKAEVPIFKKEVTVGGEFWVHDRP